MMDTFPELTTARLKLRKIRMEDVPALIRYANNKKITDNILNLPFPFQEPDAVFRLHYVLQGFKKKTHFTFTITLREREELIGEVSLHLDGVHPRAQLGYWVAEPFWNQGIGGEAAGAILQFGFEKLELDLIFASCYAHNEASQRVLLKNGMIRQGVTGRVIQYVLSRQRYEKNSRPPQGAP